MAYESGAYLPAGWLLDGQTSYTTCKIMKSEFTEEGTELVKKLAGNSALPERYAGFGDAKFTISLLVDSAALPSKSAGLGMRFGNKATIKWGVKTTALVASDFFYAHIMILKINYVNNVDDLLEYSVDVALDASANAYGQSSPYVYPTNG